MVGNEEERQREGREGYGRGGRRKMWGMRGVESMSSHTYILCICAIETLLIEGCCANLKTHCKLKCKWWAWIIIQRFSQLASRIHREVSSIPTQSSAVLFVANVFDYSVVVFIML